MFYAHVELSPTGSFCCDLTVMLNSTNHFAISFFHDVSIDQNTKNLRLNLSSNVVGVSFALVVFLVRRTVLKMICNANSSKIHSILNFRT